MTKEQYTKEMEKLDELEFLASMSDDYSVTCRELREIGLMRYELNKKAQEQGII